jgi:hypothetical protein
MDMDDDPNPVYLVTDYEHEPSQPYSAGPAVDTDTDGPMFSDSGSSYHSMSTIKSDEVAGELSRSCIHTACPASALGLI